MRTSAPPWQLQKGGNSCQERTRRSHFAIERAHKFEYGHSMLVDSTQTANLQPIYQPLLTHSGLLGKWLFEWSLHAFLNDSFCTFVAVMAVTGATLCA